MSDTLTIQAVQPASAFSPSVGLNVSSDTPAATTLQQLRALGLTAVRATVTTGAQLANLVALAQNGIRIDLVLAPGQGAAAFATVAQQINNAAPGHLAFFEGPDLVANPGYTYTNPANGAVLSGYVAANQATFDMAQAVNSAGVGGTPLLGYSSASGVPATDTTTQVGVGYININPGDVALVEPDFAAFTAAQDAGQSVNRAASQYVVTNVGGATAGSLLDAVLDAQYVYGFFGAAGGAVTAPATFLAAPTGAVNTPASLFNADNSLTAAGAAYANLSAIIAAGNGGSSAGSSLSVGLAPAETGVQYAEQLLVFAGPGGSDNVVVWGDTEGPSGGGHGPSVLSFGSVQSSVTVFDPTLGTGAVATYANISELDIANTPDGPLVVQVSGVAGSGNGAAATYAGANGGVYVVATGSGGAIYTTPINGAAVVDSSGTANDVVNSRGTDTISTGGGTDVVYASGAAATVAGGSGTLIFVAGNGNYNAGGGSSTAILYGGGGADTLTGATGAGSILVAGTGNTTLSGGGGNSAVMFGGTGATSFFGSGGGHDTMVGGTGNNTFTTTNGDIVFGGTANDSFNLTGGEIVVEGAGADTVTLYSGASTVFGGTGATGFVAATGTGVNASVVGFTAADHLTLVGASAAAVSTAVAGAATGSYGTMLSLADGTRFTLFGVTALNASQVSAG